jgi:hypothetical protein
MAYVCIGMKVQKHVNTNYYPDHGSCWYRCRKVEFIGEKVIWELSETGRYELVDAYHQAPHRQLIQAIDDAALRAFVRAWGPIRSSLDSWAGSDEIACYRRQRDLFQAWVRLIASIQKNEALHDAAANLLRQLSEEFAPAVLEVLGLPSGPNIGFDELGWNRLANASRSEIIWICNILVGALSFSPLVHSLSIESNRGGLRLTAKPSFLGLLDALRWMTWQDIFLDHPFWFCVECGKLILSENRHARRFCPTKCGHRRTARESARRKREERKKNNGTPKAQ